MCKHFTQGEGAVSSVRSGRENRRDWGGAKAEVVSMGYSLEALAALGSPSDVGANPS